MLSTPPMLLADPQVLPEPEPGSSQWVSPLCTHHTRPRSARSQRPGCAGCGRPVLASQQYRHLLCAPGQVSPTADKLLSGYEPQACSPLR